MKKRMNHDYKAAEKMVKKTMLADRKIRWRKIRNGMITTAIIIGAIVTIGRIGYYETHYEQNGKIRNVTENLITVEDTTGNLWEFYGEGYTEGEELKITFFDGGTLDLEDDQIVATEKIIHKTLDNGKIEE